MSSPRPRPNILAIKPYVGGESALPGVNRVVKLSSNEGAFGPPPAASAALVATAGDLHRYPDGGATALRQAIGRTGRRRRRSLISAPAPPRSPYCRCPRRRSRRGMRGGRR